MADTANNNSAPQGDTLGRRAWRKLKASPLTLACFGIIGVYLLLAIFGFAGLTPDFQQKVGEKFLAPSLIKPSIWLGTDVFGRSVLYKLMAGARTAITLGVLVACISVPIGLCMGAVAGYFGGKIDTAVQWVYSVIVSVPYILLIIAVSYSLGKGLLSICLAPWVSLMPWVSSAGWGFAA